MQNKRIASGVAKLLLGAAAVITSPLGAVAATDVLFVIDSSGSMNQVTSGKKQIDAAREAIVAALSDVPSDAHVGVRAYAHRVEQSRKEESCKDTELIMPLAPIDRTALAAALNKLAPKGYTPTAFALEQSHNDFSTERESEHVIVLLSDGEETCGGDPAAVIKRLQAEGVKVTVHAIGFNVDDKARAQLQAVATAGGGRYFDAKNGDQLKGALQEATKESFIISKKNQNYSGKAVRGGDGFDTAVALPLDEDLHLDHHQKKNEYDYFYVDLQPGQELTVGIKTFEKGIAIANDRVTENTTPYAGFRLLDATKNEKANAEIIGGQFASQEKKLAAKDSGRYYLAIGSVYEAINKDQSQFRAHITAKGDLDGAADAGDAISRALPLEFKRYEKNYLGGPDASDLFSFTARTGEQVQILLVPGDVFTQSLNLRLFDEVKRNVAEDLAPSGQGIKTKAISIPEDGLYYLEVRSGGAPEMEEYALELRKLPAASPTSPASNSAPNAGTPPAGQ